MNLSIGSGFTSLTKVGFFSFMQTDGRPRTKGSDLLCAKWFLWPERLHVCVFDTSSECDINWDI